METKRVLIPDEKFDGSAIKLALQLLAELSQEDEDIRECILFIPVKANIQHTTLSTVLGENVSKALYNGKVTNLGSCVLRLETARSFKNNSRGDAILAVYADQKMMDSIDSNGIFKIIIAVPEIQKEVEEWERTWSPIVPGKQQSTINLINNRVVEAALKSMTSRINLANKILHPRDEEAVKDAFRILRAHSQSEDPKSIRAWCIKNGWDAKSADQAMKHAEKAFGSKSKPIKYGTHWASNIYDQWK